MSQINCLIVSQTNCILSHNRHTHRLDKWMVRFLIAHAMELEDKVDNIRFNPVMSQTSETTLLERIRVTQSINLATQTSKGKTV